MTSDTLSAFVWIAVLAAAAIVAWIGALYVARSIRRRVHMDGTYQPFTLQDIREMRARGLITESEFATMRASILGKLRSDGDAEPNKNPPQPPPSTDEPDGDPTGKG